MIGRACAFGRTRTTRGGAERCVPRTRYANTCQVLTSVDVPPTRTADYEENARAIRGGVKSLGFPSGWSCQLMPPSSVRDGRTAEKKNSKLATRVHEINKKKFKKPSGATTTTGIQRPRHPLFCFLFFVCFCFSVFVSDDKRNLSSLAVSVLAGAVGNERGHVDGRQRVTEKTTDFLPAWRCTVSERLMGDGRVDRVLIPRLPIGYRLLAIGRRKSVVGQSPVSNRRKASRRKTGWRLHVRSRFVRRPFSLNVL